MIVEKNSKLRFIHEDTIPAKFAASEFEKYIRAVLNPVKEFNCYPIMKCDTICDTILPNEDLKVFVGRPEWCASVAGAEPEAGKLKFDGFCIKVADNRIIISAVLERGLLYGVYALLEEIGCRWFYPGELGSFIPRKESVNFAERESYDNPDFEIRAFSEGSHKLPVEIWTLEIFELIDWIGKSRCNSIFFINSIAGFPATWNAVLPEMTKRGLIVEAGTHCVQDFIPRNLFETKPDLFRMKNGDRTKDGNFCGSSSEAMEMVTSSIKAISAQNPGVDIFHLWFDDVVGGSWCECEKCESLTPADQLANIIQAIADAVKEVRPDLMIDALLYHDTLDADDMGSTPQDNIYGFFAPRERCYSHGIGDKACARNMFYFEMLEHTISKFGKNAYVFEYYDDIILFLEMKINFPAVIKKDLKQYKEIGVDKVNSLMFGRHSWWAYEFNMEAFAKLAWNTDHDYDVLLEDLCRTLYPENAGRMVEFYHMLEEASFSLLTFCGYDGATNMNNDIKGLLIEPVAFSEFHTEGIRRAGLIYSECVSLLEKLRPARTIGEAERIKGQKLVMEITARQVKALILQQTARLEYAKGSRDHDRICGLMREAMQIELDLEQWIKEVPFYTKGSVCGHVFEKMSNDQYRVYRRMNRIMST